MPKKGNSKGSALIKRVEPPGWRGESHSSQARHRKSRLVKLKSAVRFDHVDSAMRIFFGNFVEVVLLKSQRVDSDGWSGLLAHGACPLPASLSYQTRFVSLSPCFCQAAFGLKATRYRTGR